MVNNFNLWEEIKVFILSNFHHCCIEYKKNITKIKSEGNLTEDEEEARRETRFFSKDEDNTLGMDALTIIWWEN